MEVGWIRSLRTPRYELSIRDLAPALEGLRIVHLSDLHIHRTWMPAWDRLHVWLEASPPDLILVTGDWVDRKHDHRPALPLLERFIAGLRSRLGVWGILGNHDGDLLPLRAGEVHVRTLFNERTTLEHHDARLDIIGLHGVHPQDASDVPLRDLVGTTSGNGRPVRIALSHFPSRALDLAELDVDLVLAGHTHGGQVCLPGGVPIITHDPLPRRFARGGHRIGNTWLVTSRGCGFSKLPIRVFCPAEAIEIVLTAASERSAPPLTAETPLPRRAAWGTIKRLADRSARVRSATACRATAKMIFRPTSLPGST